MMPLDFASQMWILCSFVGIILLHVSNVGTTTTC